MPDFKELSLAYLKESRPDLVAALHEEGAARERRRATGAKNSAEDTWAAEWSASRKLQDDYLTAAAYVATMRRQARSA